MIGKLVFHITEVKLLNFVININKCRVCAHFLHLI